jgi:hypothetical protein
LLEDEGRSWVGGCKCSVPVQFRTQSNAWVQVRKALALGKLNFSCAAIGLTFINSACWQRTGTPKFMVPVVL